MKKTALKLTATALTTATILTALAGCATQEPPKVTPTTTTEETATTVTEKVETTEETLQVEPDTKEEITPTQEETPTVEETPEQEEPPVEETPVEETPVEETPEVEEPPVEEEPPVAEELPPIAEAPVSEEMLSVDLAAVPLSDTPAIFDVPMPKASGTLVYANAKASIDASNAADGYVMIQSLEETTATLKVIVTGPSGICYYYNLTNDGSYEVYPLSDGSGTYQFQICKNVSGTSYAISHSAKIDATLTDEYAPFLLPNQYVNYTADSNTVAKAAQLVAGYTTELEKIQSVYTYVVNNLTYDKVRATTVTSGYLPDLDAVLAEGKGICFDYAALMTAMLRSQGIPCKLVVGYAGSAYHAWINAYSSTEGWMDTVIYFDGTTWKLMDPTFASGGNSSDSIMQYIGDGANYTAKYLY